MRRNFRRSFVRSRTAPACRATTGPDSIVYAQFLDRPSGQIITAYTQFNGQQAINGAAVNAWSDYFLAPYTCYNCAPFGVDTTTKAASAKTKLAPGGGTLSNMPKTKKVLG